MGIYETVSLDKIGWIMREEYYVKVLNRNLKTSARKLGHSESLWPQQHHQISYKVALGQQSQYFGIPHDFAQISASEKTWVMRPMTLS